MQKDGKNFIVGLSLNFQHDGLVVNSIRGLYPKDLHKWLTWIQDGKTLYLNKEKVQNLIAQQRTNLADVNNLDLNSINNIIQNFENPSVSSKNPENSSGGVQFSKPGDLQTEQYAVENKMPDVPDGIDLKSASQVRNYLREAFAGRKFRIDSDGRLVAIDFPGIRSGLEKRGKSRQSLFDMENIVKNSYPVGYEFVDL